MAKKEMTVFRIFNSNDDPVLKQIGHRGFVGYANDLNEKDKITYSGKDLVFFVSGNVAQALKLINAENFDSIDVEINNSTNPEPEIISLFDNEIDKKSSMLLKVVYPDIAFRLRGRKAEILDHHVLRIDFGESLLSKDAGTELKHFIKKPSNYHETAYDGVTVIHNYKQTDYNNDIITALDTIKQKGLGSELDRQYGQGWSTVPYFSVLLISKDLDVKVSDDVTNQFRVFMAYRNLEALKALKHELESSAKTEKCF